MKTTSPDRWPKNRRQRDSAVSTSWSSIVVGRRSRSLGGLAPITQPTTIATTKPSASLPSTMTARVSRPRYAMKVDATTTGFTIGAASMNVTAAEGASPFAMSRRATGTDPHSHTGKVTPASAAAGTCSERGSPPSFANVEAGTSTSMPALTKAPSTTNGIASTRREPKTIRRFRIHATCEGSTNRTPT